MARKTKTALTRERVIDEALALIEAQGLEAFSLRKLAQRLNCEAMSLYHHFRNKDAILNAATDRLIDGLPLPDDALPPVERLRAIARSWRQLARTYPAFFRYLGLHRLNSEAGVRFLDHVMATLESTGLDTESAARLFRALNYFLLGAGLDETAGYGHGPSADEPVSDARIARDFPALARAGQYFQSSQFDETFEWGLSLLLSACDQNTGAKQSGK